MQTFASESDAAPTTSKSADFDISFNKEKTTFSETEQRGKGIDSFDNDESNSSSDTVIYDYLQELESKPQFSGSSRDYSCISGNLERENKQGEEDVVSEVQHCVSCAYEIKSCTSWSTFAGSGSVSEIQEHKTLLGDSWGEFLLLDGETDIERAKRRCIYMKEGTLDTAHEIGDLEDSQSNTVASCDTDKEKEQKYISEYCEIIISDGSRSNDSEQVQSKIWEDTNAYSVQKYIPPQSIPFTGESDFSPVSEKENKAELSLSQSFETSRLFSERLIGGASGEVEKENGHNAKLKSDDSDEHFENSASNYLLKTGHNILVTHLSPPNPHISEAQEQVSNKMCVGSSILSAPKLIGAHATSEDEGISELASMFALLQGEIPATERAFELHDVMSVEQKARYEGSDKFVSPFIIPQESTSDTEIPTLKNETLYVPQQGTYSTNDTNEDPPLLIYEGYPTTNKTNAYQEESQDITRIESAYVEGCRSSRRILHVTPESPAHGHEQGTISNGHLRLQKVLDLMAENARGVSLKVKYFVQKINAEKRDPYKFTLLLEKLISNFQILKRHYTNIEGILDLFFEDCLDEETDDYGQVIS